MREHLTGAGLTRAVDCKEGDKLWAASDAPLGAGWHAGELPCGIGDGPSQPAV